MLRKWLRSPLVTAALFVVAAGLILFGGIRGVQAAPRIQSTWFGAEVELDDIDVALTEQCKGEDSPRIVHDDENPELNSPLLTKLVGENEEFVIGKKYDEYRLGVRNTENANNNINNNADGKGGNQLIKEYVRVTVYKYWMKKDSTGKYVSAPDLDPSKIDLEWNDGNKWTIDSGASDSIGPEVRTTGTSRTVLYYSDIVYPAANKEDASNDTEPFTKSLRIDGSVLDDPDYKDAKFCIEAVVDAVQTHNGDVAMMSAWGTNDMIAYDESTAEN